MKKRVVILFFISLSSWALDGQKTMEDRVWTFTHYEYSLLMDVQKDEFAKLFYTESQNNPILKGLIEHPTEIIVKNALLSSSKWPLIEFKINKACKDQKNLKNCEKLSVLRTSVLNKYRAHK